MNFLVDKEGYYGEFGGAYVPEILHKCVEELQNTYLKVLQSEDFKREYDQLLRDYVGRPSPLYLAHRLSEKYGCRIYLKREDLNHTGAHKINNSIGQVLLARRMGKRRIIAETGAGQHGVATATVCALMNMECIVYMGKTDVERQRVNVEKMKTCNCINTGWISVVFAEIRKHSLDNFRGCFCCCRIVQINHCCSLLVISIAVSVFL